MIASGAAEHGQPRMSEMQSQGEDKGEAMKGKAATNGTRSGRQTTK